MDCQQGRATARQATQSRQRAARSDESQVAKSSGTPKARPTHKVLRANEGAEDAKRKCEEEYAKSETKPRTTGPEEGEDEGEPHNEEDDEEDEAEARGAKRAIAEGALCPDEGEEEDMKKEEAAEEESEEEEAVEEDTEVGRDDEGATRRERPKAKGGERGRGRGRDRRSGERNQGRRIVPR